MAGKVKYFKEETIVYWKDAVMLRYSQWRTLSVIGRLT
jgi:hypothetical protein